LHFVDTKKYADRLKDVMEKTKLKDAVHTGVGKSKEKRWVICMDFAYRWLNGRRCGKKTT
jgi:acetyl-CoA carboxylase carboxyl transferase subunit beta